ncbi:unnamed protein product [Gordionus sp. m RMFG-2023]
MWENNSQNFYKICNMLKYYTEEINNKEIDGLFEKHIDKLIQNSSIELNYLQQTNRDLKERIETINENVDNNIIPVNLIEEVDQLRIMGNKLNDISEIKFNENLILNPQLAIKGQETILENYIEDESSLYNSISEMYFTDIKSLESIHDNSIINIHKYSIGDHKTYDLDIVHILKGLSNLYIKNGELSCQIYAINGHFSLYQDINDNCNDMQTLNEYIKLLYKEIFKDTTKSRVDNVVNELNNAEYNYKINYLKFLPKLEDCLKCLIINDANADFKAPYSYILKLQSKILTSLNHQRSRLKFMSFMLENNFALIQEIANILADFGEEMDKLTNMQLVPFIEIMKRLGSCSPQTLLRPTNLNSICEGLNDLKMTPIDESQIAVPSNTLERLIALSRETLQKLIDVLIQKISDDNINNYNEGDKLPKGEDNIKHNNNKDTDEDKICKSNNGVMETDNENNDKINDTNNDNVNMNSEKERGLRENNEIEDTGEDIERGNKVWMNKDGNEVIVINDNNRKQISAKATSKVSKSNHLTLPENEADKLMAIKMGDIEEAIICYDEDLAKRRNRFLTKNLTK